MSETTSFTNLEGVSSQVVKKGVYCVIAYLRHPQYPYIISEVNTQQIKSQDTFIEKYHSKIVGNHRYA